MTGFTLDATDCRILAVLQEDGRISNLDLAERISLSPSACLRRMRLLEEEGVMLCPGSAFDLEGTVRMGYACDTGVLEQGLVRMSTFLARKGNR